MTAFLTDDGTGAEKGCSLNPKRMAAAFLLDEVIPKRL